MFSVATIYLCSCNVKVAIDSKKTTGYVPILLFIDNEI